jgi:hypothetical protein
MKVKNDAQIQCGNIFIVKLGNLNFLLNYPSFSTNFFFLKIQNGRNIQHGRFFEIRSMIFR